MDQVRRTNNPQGNTRTTDNSIALTPTKSSKPKKSKLVRALFVLGIVLLTAAMVGVVTYTVTTKNSPSGSSLTGVKKDQYQALFLTNGQVYFGKVTQADAQTIKISDIYYLQVQQPVQPKDEKTPEAAETQLLKLGDELHSPEDEMYIDRGQVLFWENLKDSGRVTQAIKEYSKK